MIQPVFMLELNHKILPGILTIGKYDGENACLTAATTADKVIIHNPHKQSTISSGRIQWSEAHKEVAVLNMTQAITALAAGQINPSKERDILMIGSPTQLLAYDVQENSDIFYKDAPNGVTKLVMGTFGKFPNMLVIVGGNGSVQGLDYQGNEVFWSVVGDEVKSLLLMDFDKDGTNELLVGCTDNTIRVFKEDKVVSEISETDVVIGMTMLQEARFAYSLSNGTVGIYEEGIRLWRVKSKNTPVDIFSYDLIGVGTNQLITGWTNGKIDSRDVRTGEVFYRDNLGHSIAGIVSGDYRGIGNSDLICVSVNGEVKGYTTSTEQSTLITNKLEQETMSELFARKQALLLELKHYESNIKFNEQFEKNRDENNSLPSTMGVIPANTRLQIALATNLGDEYNEPHVEVSISTNNFTIIKVVLIFAEGIFEGETLIEHPSESQLSNKIDIKLSPPKDVAVDIHIKAFVGYPDSTQFHVFELTRQLPKFSMYAMPEPDDNLQSNKNGKLSIQIPTSYVLFKITERIPRICIWINQNFLLPDDIEVPTNDVQELHILLKCLRDGSYLLMDFESNGNVKFSTVNIGLAGDLVQSLGVFLNLENLQSVGYFPQDENKLKELMTSLDGIQETRIRLDNNAAEQMQTIRYMITMAEEQRTNNLNEMIKSYGEIMNINQDLITGNNIRLINHTEGCDALKIINLLIQKASRLRIGKYATGMIASCKNAIKNKNVDSLIKVISTGEP